MSKYKIASKKTSDLLFPDVRPTLDLNFIRNQKVPPFVNVTRNSQTTYVDKFGILRTADIDQPVFEWDPITGKCLGARIWGVVTNDSKATEAIGGTGWTNQNSIGVSLNSTDVVDPAGGNKASKLTWGATNSQTLMPFTAAADVYSAGAWLRTLTGTANVTFYVFLQASPYTVIGTATVTVTSAWRRLTVTTSTATAAAYNFGIQLTGAGSVYAFGSQVNRGAVLGPYVQNNSTTLTASSTADVWSITGADAARIINTAQGALYVDFATGSAIPANQYPSPIQLQGTDRQNEVQIYAATGLVAYLIRTGSVVRAEANLSATTQNGVKSAFRYAENNSTSYVNGSPLFLDTVCTMPTTDRIFIGNNNGSENFLNGYIRRLTIYPKGLTDTQLQTLTR